MPNTVTTAKVKKVSKPLKSGSFAVIATGGKQYKVSEGDSLRVEKLIGNYKEGDSVSFDKVLLVDDGAVKVGTPLVAGAKVEAKLEKIGRAQKVVVIKYKQKSRYFKKNGHRQPFFQMKITSIK